MFPLRQGLNPCSIQIETERLLIRQPQDGDLPCFEKIFCNPERMHYLGCVWNPEQVAATLSEWRANWGVGNNWYGTLLRKDFLEPVGTAGFTENTIPGEPGLELSWFVLREQQGLGFATEITNGLVRFAFEELGAARMVAETHPENRASNRVLEKLHFRYLGKRHHSYDYLPGFDTQAFWELTREIWLQKPA